MPDGLEPQKRSWPLGRNAAKRLRRRLAAQSLDTADEMLEMERIWERGWPELQQGFADGYRAASMFREVSLA